jgi:DnaK suppressor protein
MSVGERIMKRSPRLDEETVTEIQRTLSSLLARLEASMRAALDEARTNEIGRTEDVVAQASETQHEEIQIELMNRRTDLAAQTRAALERLARGEYGICRDCGGGIGLTRLRALPFVQRCGDCQARAEFASPRAARRLAESSVATP